LYSSIRLGEEVHAASICYVIGYEQTLIFSTCN
jgi:hypothetical protein